MISVGIDVAKKDHNCCIRFDENTFKEFSFSNTREGFDLLNDTLKALNDNICVGLESTGHYGINLEAFLRNEGYTLMVFNPLIVDKFKKSQTLRKTKTDKSDARLIATLLLTQTQETTFDIPTEIKELKSLSRNRFRLVKETSKLIMQLTRILDIIFPEFDDIFYSRHCKSSYAILKAFPSTQELSNANLTKLTKILKKASHGRFSKPKAVEIVNLAKKSIGYSDRTLAFELQQTIRLIEHFEEEISFLTKEQEKLLNSLNSPITSVTGISTNLGSIILSEIGDIHRFKTPSKLLAFAGLEPSIYQSGQYNAPQGKMVKRGSPYLRWALIQAAKLISNSDKTFKDYLFKKQTTEGKPYLVALSHVAKKLVRVLFYLLKNNNDFIAQS